MLGLALELKCWGDRWSVALGDGGMKAEGGLVIGFVIRPVGWTRILKSYFF